MDPDATLDHIRGLVNEISARLADKPSAFVDAQLALNGIALADAVSDLDNWLSTGGYVPHQWSEVVDHTVKSKPRKVRRS